MDSGPEDDAGGQRRGGTAALQELRNAAPSRTPRTSMDGAHDSSDNMLTPPRASPGALPMRRSDSGSAHGGPLRTALLQDKLDAVHLQGGGHAWHSGPQDASLRSIGGTIRSVRRCATAAGNANP